MGRNDHQLTRQLVDEIDEQGVRLSKSEIDFIAGLIDSHAAEFTPDQARRVRSIHQKRVAESDPDLDLD